MKSLQLRSLILKVICKEDDVVLIIISFFSIWFINSGRESSMLSNKIKNFEIFSKSSFEYFISYLFDGIELISKQVIFKLLFSYFKVNL